MVTAPGRGAQPLVGEQCSQALPRTDAGEDECGVGVAVNGRARGLERAGRLLQKALAVGRLSGELLQLAGRHESLDIGFSSRPPGHQAPRS